MICPLCGNESKELSKDLIGIFNKEIKEQCKNGICIDCENTIYDRVRMNYNDKTTHIWDYIYER